jgi:site-specific DNA-adenine methylase
MEIKGNCMLKFNKIFNYAGIKKFIIDVVNDLIRENCIDYKFYIEPFIGSGSIFYNLENIRPALINDFDFNIVNMHKSVLTYDYSEYLELNEWILKTFGDIKSNKEAYYSFRNSWNERYWSSILNKEFGKSGLELLFLASSCINSMLRFGPNGMNQSFGNRYYVIPETNYNNIKNRLLKCKITNLSYENIVPKELHSVVMFLDPPYADREISYNHGFDQYKFLEYLKTVSGINSFIMYTDYENKFSDELLKFGYEKKILRTMRNISPNRSSEFTGNEVIYFKKF